TDSVDSTRVDSCRPLSSTTSISYAACTQPGRLEWTVQLRRGTGCPIPNGSWRCSNVTAATRGTGGIVIVRWLLDLVAFPPTQPFSDPAVRPFMTLWFNTRYTRRVGKTAMHTDANVGPHCRWPYCPTKFSRPVCTVRRLSSLMKVNDSSRSFQMKKN